MRHILAHLCLTKGTNVNNFTNGKTLRSYYTTVTKVVIPINQSISTERLYMQSKPHNATFHFIYQHLKMLFYFELNLIGSSALRLLFWHILSFHIILNGTFCLARIFSIRMVTLLKTILFLLISVSEANTLLFNKTIADIWLNEILARYKKF